MSGKASDWLACYPNLLFIYQLQLLWTQVSPEGMCTNGTQGPWEIPSLPSPKTRKGWPHHRCCDWWMNLRIMAPRKTSASVDSLLKHWYANIFRLSSMWSLLHRLWLHVYSAEKDVKRRRSRIHLDFSVHTFYKLIFGLHVPAMTREIREKKSPNFKWREVKWAIRFFRRILLHKTLA